MNTTATPLKAAATLCLLLLLARGGGAHGFQLPAPATGRILPAQGTVQVAFTPGDNATGMIVAAIRQARRQILVQAFSFTSRDIARALIDARRRGVEVDLIADREQTAKLARGMVPKLAAGGVATWLDGEHASAHNKVMVIDAGGADPVVITGSFNFTYAAQHKNAENVLLIRGDPALADAYRANWQRHRLHSVPYRTPG